MSDHDDHSQGAHLHGPTMLPLVIGHPLIIDGDFHGLVSNTWGPRIVELINRHGLADVAAYPPPTFPPPDLRTWAGRHPEGPQ